MSQNPPDGIDPKTMLNLQREAVHGRLESARMGIELVAEAAAVVRAKKLPLYAARREAIKRGDKEECFRINAEIEAITRESEALFQANYENNIEDRKQIEELLASVKP